MPSFHRITNPTVRNFVFLVGAGLLALMSWTALAAEKDGQEIAWLGMGMNLFGGLAIFLFGMEQMADSLKAVAGERMKLILA